MSAHTATLETPSWTDGRRTPLILAVVFVFALAIRLIGLDRQPLWGDELFSLLWSRFDVSFLIGEGTRIETNPPLHFLLLKVWIALFGGTAWSARLLSALVSAAAVSVQYEAGRRLLGPRGGLLAAVLLALLPLSVGMAHDVRAYGLVELATAVAFLAATAFAGSVTVASGVNRSSIGWAALFAVASTVAFLSHYTTLFFIGGCLSTVGLLLLVQRPISRSAVVAWVATGACVLVLIALPLLSAISLSQSANINWVAPTTTIASIRFVGRLFVGAAYFPLSSVIVIAIVSVAAIVVVRRYPMTSPAPWLLVVLPAITLVTFIAVSLKRPLLVAHYAEWLCIPGTLLIAAGILGLPFGRWRPVAIGAVIAAFAVLLVVQFGRFNKDNWRAATDIIAQRPECRGAIFFTPGAMPLGIVWFHPELLTRKYFQVNRFGPEKTAERYLFLHYVQVGDVSRAELFDRFNRYPHVVLLDRPRDAGPSTSLDHATVHQRLGGALVLSCR